MIRPCTGRTLVAALLLLVGVAGCKKKEEPAPEPKLTAEEKAKGQKAWAELLGIKGKGGTVGAGGTLLPAPATTLRGVVQQFTTYETCLASLERGLPPDLGVDLLTYYNIPDALCRTREALSKKDVTTCKRVQSYAMKKGCEIMHATYHQRPEDCPLSYRGRQGRDGYCLALATRNPSLCVAGRTEQEETRCKAILSKNAGACESLTRHADRQSCKSEVTRWKDEVEAGQASLPADFVPRLELDLKLEGGNRALPYRYQKVEPSCITVGAVAPTTGDSEHVNVCDYYTYGYYRRGSYSSSVYRYAKIDFSFKPPSSPTQTLQFGTDAKFAINISGFGEFGANPTGELKLTSFERKRGGRVTGTFKVTVTGAGDKLTVEGKLDTFVRDLVDPTTMRTGATYGSRYGAGGYGSRYGGLTGGTVGGGTAGGGSQVGVGLGGLGTGGYRAGGYGAPRPKRFAALLTAATLTKVAVGGKTGFQVTAIIPSSIWDRLGVRDGDVIFAVGKTTLATKSDVVRVRTELRDAKALAIRLQRNKRNMTLPLSKTTLDALRQDFYF